MARPCGLIIAALLALSPIVGAASEIVLTAFEPFGAAKVNNSNEVLKRLAPLLRSAAKGGKIRVRECVLPVVYDRAAEVAMKCVGEKPVDFVLSLGAGNCRLDFESTARNRDRAKIADNAGVLRDAGAPIIAGAPDEIPLNAPMKLLYARSPRPGKFKVRASNDAGAYVCNNTAYRLARRYGALNSKTRYGFIHVPPVTCDPAIADADLLAKTIYRAIRRGMPELF